MKTYTVKARLEFPDGCLCGTLKVKAATQDLAMAGAVAKLKAIWGNKNIDPKIMITSAVAK